MTGVRVCVRARACVYVCMCECVRVCVYVCVGGDMMTGAEVNIESKISVKLWMRVWGEVLARDGWFDLVSELGV